MGKNLRCDLRFDQVVVVVVQANEMSIGVASEEYRKPQNQQNG
jgi:hypothetical protein